MGDPIDVRESRRLNELRKRMTPAAVPKLVVTPVMGRKVADPGSATRPWVMTRERSNG